MRSQYFTQSESDHYLYTKKATNDSLVILILYVDDMLLASKHSYESQVMRQGWSWHLQWLSENPSMLS